MHVLCQHVVGVRKCRMRKTSVQAAIHGNWNRAVHTVYMTRQLLKWFTVFTVWTLWTSHGKIWILNSSMRFKITYPQEEGTENSFKPVAHKQYIPEEHLTADACISQYPIFVLDRYVIEFGGCFGRVDCCSSWWPPTENWWLVTAALNSDCCSRSRKKRQCGYLHTGAWEFDAKSHKWNRIMWTISRMCWCYCLVPGLQVLLRQHKYIELIALRLSLLAFVLNHHKEMSTFQQYLWRYRFVLVGWVPVTAYIKTSPWKQKQQPVDLRSFAAIPAWCIAQPWRFYVWVALMRMHGVRQGSQKVKLHSSRFERII